MRSSRWFGSRIDLGVLNSAQIALLLPCRENERRRGRGASSTISPQVPTSLLPSSRPLPQFSPSPPPPRLSYSCPTLTLTRPRESLPSDRSSKFSLVLKPSRRLSPVFRAAMRARRWPSCSLPECVQSRSRSPGARAHAVLADPLRNLAPALAHSRHCGEAAWTPHPRQGY